MTFTPVAVGTELRIVQEGVPDVIPAASCYLGWQESLTLLAQLVEADIPGELRPIRRPCRSQASFLWPGHG